MDLSKTDTASIKGIAILFMLWHHQFLNMPEYGMPAQSMAVAFKACVALFLFVSGYGMTKQFSGQDHCNAICLIKFLLHRFINFFFSYWFCFILVTLIGNLCGITFHDVYPTTRSTLKCIFLDFWGMMGYNSYLHPWWFNKMIIQLYLIFPFLYVIVSRQFFAWAGLIIIIFLQLFAKNIPGNVFFLVEGGVPAFYLGMLSARYKVIPSIPQKKWKIIWTVVSAILIVCLFVLHNSVIQTSPYQAILIRALLAFLIVLLFSFIGGEHTPVLVFFGKYSAIMYLTHALLIQLIPNIVFFPKYSFPAFLIFVIISLLLAIAIDRLQKVLRYDKLRLTLIQLVSCS